MPIEMDRETYYSTDEACGYLGVSRDTLNRMTKDGRLHKYRRGFTRTTYYRETELAALKTFHKVDNDEVSEN